MTKGSKIKEVREHSGYSQTELAELISVSKQTLYKYENDIISNIPSDKIEAIAAICHTHPEYIMEWSDTPEYYPNPETARIAQEIFDNPNMRALFDAAKDVPAENLKLAAQMLEAMKKNEEGLS